MNWDIDKEYRPGRLWIIGRAALAVALMLVYFVLGATLGVGLCYLAYRQGSVTIIGLLCMVPGSSFWCSCVRYAPASRNSDPGWIPGSSRSYLKR